MGKVGIRLGVARGEPTLADRAFFYSLQGLRIEWIAHRMGLKEFDARRLVREGMERSRDSMMRAGVHVAMLKEAAE